MTPDFVHRVRKKPDNDSGYDYEIIATIVCFYIENPRPRKILEEPISGMSAILMVSWWFRGRFRDGFKTHVQSEKKSKKNDFFKSKKIEKNRKKIDFFKKQFWKYRDPLMSC